MAGIPFFGWLQIRSVRRLYIAGALLLAISAIPLLTAIGSGSALAFQIAVIVGLSINYAVMFGPHRTLQRAVSARLRYSGMSIGIQVAGALGGGLAPIVATSSIAGFGTIQAVGVYLAALDPPPRSAPP